MKSKRRSFLSLLVTIPTALFGIGKLKPVEPLSDPVMDVRLGSMDYAMLELDALAAFTDDPALAEHLVPMNKPIA